LDHAKSQKPRREPRPYGPGYTGSFGAGLEKGDEVEAHFGTGEGDKSHGFEDATVIAVSQNKSKVRVQYVDGLIQDIPPDWIVRRRPDTSPTRPASALGATDLTKPIIWSASPIPGDEADWALLRLLQRQASSADVGHRVRTLCGSAQGVGLGPLRAAIHTALVVGPAVQKLCIEALCDLCAGGMHDALAARALANAIILSNVSKLACSHRHRTALRRAAALSEVQRAKLVGRLTAEPWLMNDPSPTYCHGDGTRSAEALH